MVKVFKIWLSCGKNPEIERVGKPGQVESPTFSYKRNFRFYVVLTNVHVFFLFYWTKLTDASQTLQISELRPLLIKWPLDTWLDSQF